MNWGGKMIKGKQKFLTMFLSGMLVFNFVTTTQVMATEKNTEEKVTVKNINPKVKTLEELGNGFLLTKNVNIIGEDTEDSEAVNFLKEILGSYGIGVSKTFDRNNTTIVLGEVSGDDVDQEVVEIVTSLNKSNDEALTKKDGYILHSSNDYEGGESGVIVIAGKEEEGTYYGVSSLKQILHGGEEVKIPEVHVSDYSSIEFRGIVEGFYGEQWSHENRKSLLELSGDYKMNSYIYGPKDDPYHRDKWRDPYPEGEAKKIQELATVASKNNVDLVWAIHPGGSITFTEQDYTDLLNKCKLMYDLGVRAFAVFFDDISGPGADANKQAEFLNRLNEDLVKGKGDVASLIMCPTEYNKWWANPKPGTYLDILGEKLDKDVQIMWTGDRVMSDINKASLEWVNNRVKRDVYVWWNFPVNDYCRDRLLLGESYGLANDVDNASGFVSNPMNQAQASKFSLYSVANYSWNVEDYNSTESWNNAIGALVPEVQNDFKIFGIHNADAYTDYHQYRRKESEHMKPFVEEFRTNLESDGDIKASAERILEEFVLIENAGRNIYENCADEGIIADVEPWVLAFEQLGIAGQSVINSILALQEGNFESWWENYSKTKQALDEMKRISDSNNFGERRGANVATHVLTPFIKDMFVESENLYKEILGDTNTSIYELNPITSYNNTNLEAMVDGDEGTNSYIQVQQKNGDYYGVDLGEVIPVNDVRILQGRTDSDHDIFHRGILEYSLDGKTWVGIGDEREGYEIVAEDLGIEARYIRYRLTHAGIPGGKPDLWTAVREFSINYKTPQKNITNIEELKGLKVKVKDDGTISYPKVNDLVVEKDEYLGFELNSLIKITSLNLDFESERSPLTLEYSINGIEWNEYNGSPIVAKYVRAINKGEEATTGNIKKFEVSQVVNASPVATTNATVYEGETSNLVDGNKSTHLWTEEQRTGQCYQVDLGGQVELHDVTVYMDRGDYIRSGVLEVSKNGESWTTLNDFSAIPQGNNFTSNLMREVNKIVSKFDSSLRKYEEPNTKVDYKEITGDAEGESYRYIRLRVTGDSNYWAKINEIEFNKDVPEEIISAVSGNLNGEFAKVADGRIDTAYIAGTNPKEGDYLLYKMITVKPMDSINILQNPKNISNGVVSVRVLGEGWIKLGTLDSSFNYIDLSSLKNKNVLDIKIDWVENGVKPFIYEITPIYKDGDESNKEELISKVDEANVLLEESVEGIKIGEYHEGSKERLENAIKSATLVIENSAATIVEINEALNKLNDSLEKFTRCLITESTGDLNGDGKINVGDLAIVSKLIETNLESNLDLADLDLDGEVSEYEIVFISNRILN